MFEEGSPMWGPADKPYATYSTLRTVPVYSLGNNQNINMIRDQDSEQDKAILSGSADTSDQRRMLGKPAGKTTPL